jgi:hypothetical protein
MVSSSVEILSSVYNNILISVGYKAIGDRRAAKYDQPCRGVVLASWTSPSGSSSLAVSFYVQFGFACPVGI